MKYFRKPVFVLMFVVCSGLLPAIAGLPPVEPIGPPTLDEIEEEIEHDLLTRSIRKWRDQTDENPSFQVKFRCVERSVARNQVRKYTGTMSFAAPDRFAIDYDATPEGGRVQILWNGPRVTMLDHILQTKASFTRHQPDRWATFGLGTMPGFFKFQSNLVYPPLRSDPFVGLRKDGRFKIQLIGRNDDAILFRLVDNQYARDTTDDIPLFSMAFVELSLLTFLPNRILLVSPNGRETQTYDFDAPIIRDRIDPEVFEPPLGDSWKEIELNQLEVHYF